eukprot:1143586-Prorocentrum_minimum.AAC.1
MAALCFRFGRGSACWPSSPSSARRYSRTAWPCARCASWLSRLSRRIPSPSSRSRPRSRCVYRPHPLTIRDPPRRPRANEERAPPKTLFRSRL